MTTSPCVHRAVLALAMVAFTIGVAEFTVTALLPDIAAGYERAPGRMAWAISGYALGAVVGAPTIVLLGARLPRKRLLLLLATVVVLGNGAAMVAPTATHFTVARFVAGLPHGAFFAVAASTIVVLVPWHRRGRAIAAVFVGQTIATIAGVPTAAWLGQTMGWRAAFVVVLLAGSVAVAAVGRFVPTMTAEPLVLLRDQLGAVRDRRLWAGLAMGAAGVGGVFAVLSFLAPLASTAGLPAAAMPLVMMMFGLGATAGALIGGRNADRDAIAATRTALAFTTGSLVVVAATATAWWGPLLHALLLGLALQLLVTSSQLRAVHAASAAPALGAALNQSALNIGIAAGTGVTGAILTTGAAPAVSPWIALVFLGAAAMVAATTRGWHAGPRKCTEPVGPADADVGGAVSL